MLVKVGGFAALAGVISSVLSLIGYNLRILMWIDVWGAAAGWGIRIALVVVGAVAFVLGNAMGGDEEGVPSRGR
ncbi:MAG: hypothetical protein IPG50_18930 [Myxococcales bacterium]|nr:hypothetical protein [Myxococcales bacterium]